ncbi:hypothetical protein BC829DRAFT_213862 [Chytridium lagenaria]|nr:hypothetical protein BC829DRAFT_213862 [Chytridium lagenaria]
MVAMIVFTDPLVSFQGVGEYMEKARSALPDDDTNVGVRSMLDLALTSLLDLNFEGAIMYCTRIDPWLVTHLTDLLDKFGRLDMAEGRETFTILSSPFEEDERVVPVYERTPTLREWYIMEYADPLASHTSLWRVGIEYLLYGGGDTEMALNRLDMHIMRLDVGDGTGPSLGRLWR